MKKMTPLVKQLERMNACEDAVKWVGTKSLKTAWAECTRPGWMEYYLNAVGVLHEELCTSHEFFDGKTNAKKCDAIRKAHPYSSLPQDPYGQSK
jgi:hypothetical protein